MHGVVNYADDANQLFATVTIGKVRKKSQEYFEGTITHKGKHICNVYGNYCGYIDFDGVRYWDQREVDKVWQEYTMLPQDKILPSDSIFRQDALTLKTGDVDQAQVEKEKIEVSQRYDKKLRDTAEKRRQQGGPKIVSKY